MSTVLPDEPPDALLDEPAAGLLLLELLLELLLDELEEELLEELLLLLELRLLLLELLLELNELLELEEELELLLAAFHAPVEGAPVCDEDDEEEDAELLVL